MANMSYCRFENTMRDLRDCEEALRRDGLDGLSDDELRAAKRLIRVCASIVEMGLTEVEAAR
jgi:hypothetical protein